MKLEIKEISKSFSKDKVILDNVSFSIDEGEFIVFLGPSGCGKTTLLRIIAGLEKEDSGEIFFDEKKINDYEPKDRNIGMVFQNYALYPHLNVFENIAFPLKINKVKKKIIKERVEEVSEFVGLKDYLNYLPKQLSGGQRQRVALGRAISRNPKLFLFDEPLSNLDAKLRSTMRIELFNLHKKLKTTSIYVTHDQVEAMTMGDKIIILNNGKIQQIGSPSFVYENPSNLFVASFIGNPQINLFPGSINEKSELRFVGHSNFSLEINDLYKRTDKDKFTIGIRPENISTRPIFEKSLFFGKYKVFSSEFMGNETIINFLFNDEIKSFRTNEVQNFNKDDILDIYFNADKLILFDEFGNKI